MIAPGKRRAARGYGHNMIFSFFPSGLPRKHSGQTRREKRGWVGWRFTRGGGLPPPLRYGGQAAALPRAIIRPPRWGSGKANNTLQATSVCASLFFLAQPSGAPDLRCWAA